jgi:ribosomal protein S18 acetylase RimI-like enzyme
MGEIMIPINIMRNNIRIKNIEADELGLVLLCINETPDNYMALGRDVMMSIDEIEQRYLESLINSLEFFCGIYKDSGLIGIIKGRIENRNEKELWILSYIFLKEYRTKGYGTKVLGFVEEYFKQDYSMNKFCVLIMENNETGLKFWSKNRYYITRITKANNIKNNSDMVILQKKIENSFK